MRLQRTKRPMTRLEVLVILLLWPATVILLGISGSEFDDASPTELHAIDGGPRSSLFNPQSPVSSPQLTTHNTRPTTPSAGPPSLSQQPSENAPPAQASGVSVHGPLGAGRGSFGDRSSWGLCGPSCVLGGLSVVRGGGGGGLFPPWAAGSSHCHGQKKVPTPNEIDGVHRIRTEPQAPD